jgi:hypothetical protein
MEAPLVSSTSQASRYGAFRLLTSFFYKEYADNFFLEYNTALGFKTCIAVANIEW